MSGTVFGKPLEGICEAIASLDTAMTSKLPEYVSVQLTSARDALASALGSLTSHEIAASVSLTPERIKALASVSDARTRKDLLMVAASVGGLAADEGEIADNIGSVDVSRDDTGVKFNADSGRLVADVDCDFSLDVDGVHKEYTVRCQFPIPSACILNKAVADEIELEGLAEALTEVSASAGGELDEVVNKLTDAGFSVEVSDGCATTDVYCDGGPSNFNVAKEGSLYKMYFDGEDPKGLTKNYHHECDNVRDVVYFASLMRRQGADYDSTELIKEAIREAFKEAGVSDPRKYTKSLTVDMSKHSDGVSRSNHTSNFNNSKSRIVDLIDGVGDYSDPITVSPYTCITVVRWFILNILAYCKQDGTDVADALKKNVEHALSESNAIMRARHI